MSKKIVLFSDGTGNSSAKAQKTNVWRLFQALDQATIDQIAALLSHFPEAQRATVAMKISGLKYREIATALGKSEAAVAQDYSRAIKRLAEALEGDRVAAAAGEGDRS